jgi:hypothetical protein
MGKLVTQKWIDITNNISDFYVKKINAYAEEIDENYFITSIPVYFPDGRPISLFIEDIGDKYKISNNSVMSLLAGEIPDISIIKFILDHEKLLRSKYEYIDSSNIAFTDYLEKYVSKDSDLSIEIIKYTETIKKFTEYCYYYIQIHKKEYDQYERTMKDTFRTLMKNIHSIEPIKLKDPIHRGDIYYNNGICVALSTNRNSIETNYINLSLASMELESKKSVLFSVGIKDINLGLKKLFEKSGVILNAIPAKASNYDLEMKIRTAFEVNNRSLFIQ